MIVRDVMQRDVVTVSPDMSVREVAQTLVGECIGAAPAFVSWRAGLPDCRFIGQRIPRRPSDMRDSTGRTQLQSVSDTERLQSREAMGRPE